MSYLFNFQASKYKTIGGWLFFFCFLITVSIPLGVIYKVIFSYIKSHIYFHQYPGLEIVFYIDSCLSVALAVLSIRAGIAMIRIKPNAVQNAKNFLLIYLAYTVIVSLLPFLSGLPKETNIAMVPTIISSACKYLFYSGIWFWYLNVSKRVRETYKTFTFTDDSLPSEKWESD